MEAHAEGDDENDKHESESGEGGQYVQEHDDVDPEKWQVSDNVQEVQPSHRNGDSSQLPLPILANKKYFFLEKYILGFLQFSLPYDWILELGSRQRAVLRDGQQRPADFPSLNMVL